MSVPTSETLTNLTEWTDNLYNWETETDDSTVNGNTFTNNELINANKSEHDDQQVTVDPFENMSDEEIERTKTIIGYPILLHKDKSGHFGARPELEPLSYYDFLDMSRENPQKNNFYYTYLYLPNGKAFNHWIPICSGGKEQLFKDMEIIKNSLSIVKFGYRGHQYHEFRPEIILDVFPVLLNKITLRLIRNDLQETSKVVAMYYQIYRLFVLLMEVYPFLRDEIDNECETFRDQPRLRNKKHSGDIGELILRIVLSNVSYNDVKCDLFREHLARQVYYVHKKLNGHRLNPNDGNYISKMFGVTAISNQLFLFHFHMAKFFCKSDIQRFIIEHPNTLTPPVEYFSPVFQVINNIRTQVTNYPVFLKASDLNDVITSPAIMKDYLTKSETLAHNQGYLKHENN